MSRRKKILIGVIIAQILLGIGLVYYFFIYLPGRNEVSDTLKQRDSSNMSTNYSLSPQPKTRTPGDVKDKYNVSWGKLPLSPKAKTQDEPKIIHADATSSRENTLQKKQKSKPGTGLQQAPLSASASISRSEKSSGGEKREAPMAMSDKPSISRKGKVIFYFNSPPTKIYEDGYVIFPRRTAKKPVSIIIDRSGKEIRLSRPVKKYEYEFIASGYLPVKERIALNDERARKISVYFIRKAGSKGKNEMGGNQVAFKFNIPPNKIFEDGYLIYKRQGDRETNSSVVHIKKGGREIVLKRPSGTHKYTFVSKHGKYVRKRIAVGRKGDIHIAITFLPWSATRPACTRPATATGRPAYPVCPSTPPCAVEVE